MRSLSTKDLKRRPKIVLDKIIETDSAMLASEDMSVIFPARWLDNAANLARIDITVSLLGILCFIDKDNNYMITKIPTRITCNPNRITDITIDDVLYKEMHFSRGEQVIVNRDIVKDNSDLFTTFSEFFFKANIPFYLSEKELTQVFINADKFAGSKVGQNSMALELMTSVVAKDKNDLSIPFRIAINKDPNAQVQFVNLLNPYYTFKSTFGRISGSYAKQGRLAALVDPSTNTENKIEQILRA